MNAHLMSEYSCSGTCIIVYKMNIIRLADFRELATLDRSEVVHFNSTLLFFQNVGPPQIEWVQILFLVNCLESRV